MIALTALLLALGATDWGAAQTMYVAAPESEVVIRGSSTVNEFSCRAGAIDARTLVRASSITNISSPPTAGSEPDVHVRIPVASFDCGKRAMNEDMYEALREDDHSEIHFELNRAQLSRPDTAERAYRFDVTGNLTIAATSRRVSVEAYSQPLSSERIRITGQIPLRMSSFGVTPPTALLGLIKARDQITVTFDLIAHTTSSGNSSSG